MVSVQPSRPWKVELGNAVPVEIKPGWKVHADFPFDARSSAVNLEKDPGEMRCETPCACRYCVLLCSVLCGQPCCSISATAPLTRGLGAAFEPVVGEMLKAMKTGGWSQRNYQKWAPKVIAIA